MWLCIVLSAAWCKALYWFLQVRAREPAGHHRVVIAATKRDAVQYLAIGAVRCIWFGAVLRGAMRCSAVRSGAMPSSTVRCGAVQCSAVQCGAVWRGVARCGAVGHHGAFRAQRASARVSKRRVFSLPVLECWHASSHSPLPTESASQPYITVRSRSFVSLTCETGTDRSVAVQISGAGRLLPGTGGASLL